MFFSMYVKSCWQCRTEYKYRGLKAMKAFVDGCRGKCPNCRGFLSPTPLNPEIPAPPSSPNRVKPENGRTTHEQNKKS